MTVYPELPPILRREGSIEWNTIGNQFSPGQTLSGIAPSIRTDGGGLWSAVLSNIMLSGASTSNGVQNGDQHRAFRALRVLANGGASPIIVPRHDIIQPWPVVGGVPLVSYGAIPHDDGSFFSDGTGYYQPVIDAVSVGSAALRDTSIVIEFIYGSPLGGGECFSILHPTMNWRMYEISTIADDGFGNSVVSFLPPLREAVTNVTAIEFDSPRCLMRLATLDGMHSKLDAPWISTQSMAFLEHFD